MTANRLSPFQTEVLQAFFERNQDFFLTGGAALAGFHLGHRGTEDLDLFVTSDLLDDGDRALRAAANVLGATVENLQTSPAFRRRLVRRGNEGVVVDLVHDHTPQLYPEKQSAGVLRIDPPEEIFANKLCALLSRAEIRDLVDVLALERAGFSVERAVSEAGQKDGGLTPGQLAWVLSQIEIGDDAEVPGAGDIEEAREGLRELRTRLTRMAFPSSDSE